MDGVRLNHPNANGAKMGDHSLGDVPCYAEYGMIDWDTSPSEWNWHTCMFIFGTTTSAPTPPPTEPTPPPTPAPPPNCGRKNGPSGTIESEGYPAPPPSGMDQCQYTIKCGQAGGNKDLIVKSEVGYELNYSCEAPPPCEDKWPQKKCKKCNAKKCKKSKSCKKNCRNTCDLCDNR